MSNQGRDLRGRDSTVSRRAAIQVGAVGLVGLGMGDLARLQAAQPNSSAIKAKSVVYIFLSGGLAQHESFDMKPDGPAAIRGEFKPIPTRTPGIQICEHLPRLATQSERWALVRSLTHPFNEHSQGHMVMLSGRTQLPEGFDFNRPKPTDWPAIGAVAGYAFENPDKIFGVKDAAPAPGGSSPKSPLPQSIVLPHALVHRSGRVIPGQYAGIMGSQWDPWLVKAAVDCKGSYGACPDCFHHASGAFDHAIEPAFEAPSLRLPEGLTTRRLGRRLGFLKVIEDQQRDLDKFSDARKLSRHREQAASLLADARVQRAFDVSNVDPVTLDRYGRHQFGRSLLMTRQLLEVGARLVQVNLGNNETWDTHQAAFRNLKDHLLPPLDQSLSAFLDDLAATGLLDETLVVMAGEFGRTPRIFKIPGAPLAGRDHWGPVQTVFFAGGGVRGGTVIGSSDAAGAYPDSDPQKVENMAATIYQALGIPPSAAWYDATDRPHHIYHAEPIADLIA